MQAVRVLLVFECCAYILCIEFDQHVVPTLRSCRQFGESEGGLNGVFGIHERDRTCLYTQAVHTQCIKRQGEGGSVLFHRVR